jgi:hypothetical protein
VFLTIAFLSFCFYEEGELNRHERQSEDDDVVDDDDDDDATTTRTTTRTWERMDGIVRVLDRVRRVRRAGRDAVERG